MLGHILAKSNREPLLLNWALAVVSDSAGSVAAGGQCEGFQPGGPGGEVAQPPKKHSWQKLRHDPASSEVAYVLKDYCDSCGEIECALVHSLVKWSMVHSLTYGNTCKWCHFPASCACTTPWFVYVYLCDARRSTSIGRPLRRPRSWRVRCQSHSSSHAALALCTAGQTFHAQPALFSFLSF